MALKKKQNVNANTMKRHVVMSVDGKLITDPSILEQFSISRRVGDENSNRSRILLEECTELNVTILPIIVGGSQSSTIGGNSDDFLKVPMNFSLISRTIKEEVLQLSYVRRAEEDLKTP